MNKSDINFAHFTIDELVKDKPFYLELNADERESLEKILRLTQVEQDYAYELLHQLNDCTEEVMRYGINEDKADRIYSVLTMFLNRKDIRILQSLGEMS